MLGPKPRKCREVKDLGDKVEVIQSYYACLNPKYISKFPQNDPVKMKTKEEDNNSEGSILCCK